MDGMCGRYASIKAPADLADEFRAVDATDGAAQADYNVAPTKQIVAVVSGTRATRRARPDPETVPSAPCGWCAGGWCRPGRRTRRAAPG